MILKYQNKELNWIDLENPQDSEILYILDEYQIPSIIKEEMEIAKTEDIVRLYNEYIFISLYFPQLSINKKVDNRLIFIASEKYIISIHNEPIYEINEFLKEIELKTINNQNLDISDNKLLFANLLKSLYSNSHKQIIIKENKIKNLKKQIIFIQKRVKLFNHLIIILLIIIIFLIIYVISTI